MKSILIGLIGPAFFLSACVSKPSKKSSRMDSSEESSSSDQSDQDREKWQREVSEADLLSSQKDSSSTDIVKKSGSVHRSSEEETMPRPENYLLEITNSRNASQKKDAVWTRLPLIEYGANMLKYFLAYEDSKNWIELTFIGDGNGKFKEVHCKEFAEMKSKKWKVFEGTGKVSGGFRNKTDVLSINFKTAKFILREPKKIVSCGSNNEIYFSRTGKEKK